MKDSDLAFRFSTGCLVITLVVVLIGPLHSVFVVADSYTNQAKWEAKGSANYTVAGRHDAFGGVWGSVTVENGKVIRVETGDASPFPLDQYQILTVDGMFDYIRSKAFVPFSWMAVDYDPVYGYPKRVSFFVPSLGEYDNGITVDSLRQNQ